MRSIPQFLSQSCARILLLLFSLSFIAPVFAANTVVTNQLGQGVVYYRYHYDNLYNSLQEVYLIDVNLNDPAPSLKVPYLTGGSKRTISQHAATVAGAVACVNGQFGDASGSIQFLKVSNNIVNPTKPAVHDQQALADDGTRHTNSISIVLRPSGGWSNLASPNIVASGPDLIKNGVKVTNYDMNDDLVTNRHPRTCVGWSYDNHLLFLVVDGRSESASGMTLPQLRDHLFSLAPIRNAFNLDGGGSSTMWATGTVVNVPSDGHQRAVVNALAIVAPPPALPAPPLGLKCTPGNGTISLSWSVSSGAMNYNLKRSTTSNGPYTTIASPTSTSFTNSGLSAGTSYYYVVSAVNSIGESANSDHVTAITTPPAPASLSASPGNGQISLNWSPSAGASRYNLKRSTVNGGPYTVIATSNSNSFTSLGLVNGITYYYVVSAVNSTGESSNSVQVSATPQCFIPSVPIDLVATMVNGQIVVRWSAVSSATTYSLLRSTNVNGPYSSLFNGLAITNYIDSAITPGRIYFYKISAGNTCGSGLYSGEVSAPLLFKSPGILGGSNLIFSGWGGAGGRSFSILQSTNPTLPLGDWTLIATNLFAPNGAFNVTNSIDPAKPVGYFLLRTTLP